MIKKLITVLCAGLLAAVCFCAVGCTSGGSTQAAAEPDGLPALLPADHEGRLATMTGADCFVCHEDPGSSGAQEMPEDHYVDGSRDSGAIDSLRNQCGTCHGQGTEAAAE